MRFDDLWIGPEQMSTLIALIQSTNGLSGEVLEIGTWQGYSAIQFANVIKPAKLHVVDHWQGDPAMMYHPEWFDRDNEQIFRDNIREAGVDNIVVWKMDWREWAEQWTQPIRFIQIDADHSTQEVYDNIKFVQPLMVKFGVIAGDDWKFPTVQEAVTSIFPPGVVNVQENQWWVIAGNVPDEPEAVQVGG